MARGRRPEGKQALSNAERQARYRRSILDYVIADTKKPYRNHYHFIVDFDGDGKVIHSLELSNPLVMNEARTPGP